MDEEAEAELGEWSEWRTVKCVTVRELQPVTRTC